MATSPYWHIQLLGGLRAARRDQDPSPALSRFRVHKAGALLAYLAYHLQRSHPREILIERFWPEEPVEVARHKLSVALSFLRQDLEPPDVPDGAVIVADRFTIGLSAAAVTTDVSELERALRAAAGL